MNALETGTLGQQSLQTVDIHDHISSVPLLVVNVISLLAFHLLLLLCLKIERIIFITGAFFRDEVF